MGGVMEGQSNDRGVSSEEEVLTEEEDDEQHSIHQPRKHMTENLDLDENFNKTEEQDPAKVKAEVKASVVSACPDPESAAALILDKGREGQVITKSLQEHQVDLPPQKLEKGQNHEDQDATQGQDPDGGCGTTKPSDASGSTRGQGQDDGLLLKTVEASGSNEGQGKDIGAENGGSDQTPGGRGQQGQPEGGTTESLALPASGKGLRVPWHWTDQMTLQQYRGTRAILSPDEVAWQRQRLPIYQFREQLLNAVRFNQVVVVKGETASGKSTQMPQYLVEAGLVGESGRIAITQPRRVAAVSLASRVAQERGCSVGEAVGYAIRFEDVTGPQTHIKYVTDGLLVMECLRDPTFSSYGCIILDEAHERTLHTDILLGLLKKATRLRPELKVVVTSATLDIKKFADYFGAPMLKIPGKIFPVSVRYLTSRNLPSLWSRSKRTDAYLAMAVERVVSIHTAELGKPGDILLFLPGKEEVEAACERLARKAPDLMPLPVYAALPFEAQCVIFNSAPQGVRKVVVATNIAETSITIDGVRFVIDTGLFKECTYDHGIDTLRVTVISKAQANQRAGRAGRTAPGICHRLYTTVDYDRMNDVPSPAIHRADFTSTALQLKAMGIDDICGFGFMDQPRKGRVNQALHRLGVIGALDRLGRVTDLGFKMAEFPLLPNLSKILLTAAEKGCSDEVLTIVSMLSAKYVFVRPRKRTAEADAAKKKFLDPMGDHMTLLNVFNAWKDNGMLETWSRTNFVHQKEMERAFEIRTQLLALMTLHEVPIVSAGRYLSNIRKALSTGEPNNVACRDFWYRGDGSGSAYRTYIDHQLVFIHPSSALFKSDLEPEFVIYHETITTTRNFMRTVSVCERSWLPQLLNQVA